MRLQRRLLTGVLFVARHPRLVLCVVVLTVAAAVGVAVSFLRISTDQNQLFSAKVSFFADYLNFIHTFPENEAVYIVIEPRAQFGRPTLDEWKAVADTVTDRLNSMTETVRLAVCRVPLDQLGRQGILFEDPSKLPEDLKEAQQLVPLAKFWGEKPGVPVSLMGNSPLERFLSATDLHRDDQTAGFVRTLAQSWVTALKDPSHPLTVGDGVVDLSLISATDPSQLGYFYVPDELDRTQYRILVRVYPKSKHDSLTSVTQTVDAIRDAAVAAAAPFNEFRIGVTGRPALEADEMRATDSDSHHAEACAIVAVFFAMALMLRSFWLALAAEIALGVGIGWTFGWATVAVGQLNLLSLVFLIALIGIGMDYLVQILTRYRLEARRYQRPGAIWVRVFKHVGAPINTACLGAAGAFLASVFTTFRGAANLGVIAGGGLLLCLLAGYTVLPALLVLHPPKLKPFDAQRRYGPPRRRMSGYRRLLLPAVWLVVMALVAPYARLAHFNPGLIELQVPNLESVDLIRTLQAWSAVVLSKDTAKLRQIRDAVANLDVVASTESVVQAEDNRQWLLAHGSELPTVNFVAPDKISADDIPKIEEKARTLADHFAAGSSAAKTDAAAPLREFADLCAKTPNAAARLSEWQDVFVGELQDMVGKFHPGPLDMKAVPAELRDHLVSADGTYALYIYPREDLWIRANLDQFTTQVEAAVGTVPDAPPVTGIASNVYHTTGSIRLAFYHATEYALGLIFVLVLIDFRRIGPTLAAISVLALGLPMLLAIMGRFGMSWNFANFFGLPILIGAGHEYGVFMVHRYQEACKYPRRVWRSWDTSDRALLLCAMITSGSFGFFWLLARHQGIKSLGAVMTIGTVCIYLAAVIVLRPFLRWRLESGKATECEPPR
jgi:predicted RND superfamily exporter protein